MHGLRGKPGLTARAPWWWRHFWAAAWLRLCQRVAEVGLPQKAIPIALLMFNVGVEVGQLIFVGTVLTLIALFRRFSLSLPRWAEYAAPYGIGTVAMFWVIERVGSFWA